MNLKNFYIAIYFEESNTLRIPFFVDEIDEDFLDKKPLLKTNSLTGEVILKGEPVFLTKKQLQKRAAKNRIVGTAPKIYLGVPLKKGGKILGIIAAQSYDDPEYFTQRDLDILIMVSNQIATVIDEKRTRSELDRVRNYMYNIINSMPSILVVVDKEQQVTQWNFQAELETGKKPEDAFGKVLTDVFPRLSRHIDHIKDAIRTNRIKTRLKQRYMSDTEEKFEDVIIYPLLATAEDGVVFVDGVVIRLDDITDQVLMEEMMIQSEKMLSIGGLAAGMAHEINNPLAGMMQNAQVIYNRLSQDIPANIKAADEVGISMDDIRAYMGKREILQKLDMINETGNRSAAIVKNMLSFSRKSDTVLSEHDVAEILKKTIDLSRNDYNLTKNYDFKLIRIIEEFDPELPLVRCDKSKIQLVFLNILKNGAQAMFEKQEPGYTPHFILRTYKETNMVCIEIEDNGPGLEEETHKRLFEPFYTTKGTGKGTGLGLSVSYFIIATDHNGKLAVESTKDEKTKFIIRLPF